MLSLVQYKNEVEWSSEHNQRLERCASCGRLNPWLHGQYSRKADRINTSADSLNPILIQRYYCVGCGKTTSVLPECIPPRRWYLWEIQQVVLVLFLSGKSRCSIAKQTIPSRHTIARWARRFVEQYRLYKDVLCTQIIDLGRLTGITDFWSACFEQMTLGSAMRICYAAGVPVP